MDIFCVKKDKNRIDTAVFDFDGTLSKLRAGWENVMGPLMRELIPGDKDEVKELVDKYIDESTGIQTILQMRWLAATVSDRGGKSLDPWDYKKEYLKRLMVMVENRKENIKNGSVDPEDYKVYECDKFLSYLKECGVKICAASGTDEKDVKIEAEILGFDKYFYEIRGAVDGTDACSKETVLKKLVNCGDNLLVVGDGKVEIALGKQCGAFTIGVASNDVVGDNSDKFNDLKYVKLKNAGADVMVADFREYEKLAEMIF